MEEGFARAHRQAPVDVRQLHTVYYDTPDLRLTRWGCSLRYRPDEGWTLRIAILGRAAEIKREEHRFAGDDATVPPAALELATGFLRGAVPIALAELRTLGPGPALPDELLEQAAASPAVPRLDRNARCCDLYRATMARSIERLVRCDAALRLHPDAEGVHEARVAVRRMRSDLRTFAPILDAAWGGDLRERMRWLSDGLSAARNADVLLERLQHQAEALPDVDRRRKDSVLLLLRVVRDAAYRNLDGILRDRRYVALLDDLVAAVAQPRFNESAERAALDVIPAMMDDAWRKLRKAVRRRSRPASDNELHGIRIKAKRVRYAAEAMTPVVGKRAAAFARGVERLQNILGDQHDAAMSCEQLRARVGGSDGAFLAGELAALENEVALDGRRHWRHAWRNAARRDRRFWQTGR
jgi:CHAD domain-containing protein